MCGHLPGTDVTRSAAGCDDWPLEAHQDLYLPCGVKSLDDLRTAMAIEEATLVALAESRERAANRQAARRLTKAQSARAARLLELRSTAQRRELP